LRFLATSGFFSMEYWNVVSPLSPIISFTP
jgi:hypothetical protein